MSKFNRFRKFTEASREPEAAAASPAVAPPVDIYENEREFLVLADVPGVTTEDVKIRYEADELRLEAGRAGDEQEPAIAYRRVFRLPESVDSSAIDATLVAGVLRLTLPKSTKARPREIKVMAG
jgi:HSP20 family protein